MGICRGHAAGGRTPGPSYGMRRKRERWNVNREAGTALRR